MLVSDRAFSSARFLRRCSSTVIVRLRLRQERWTQITFNRARSPFVTAEKHLTPSTGIVESTASHRIIELRDFRLGDYIRTLHTFSTMSLSYCNLLESTVIQPLRYQSSSERLSFCHLSSRSLATLPLPFFAYWWYFACESFMLLRLKYLPERRLMGSIAIWAKNKLAYSSDELSSAPG